MIGQTVGPYQILSKVGEGGMGEVYLADDRRLGRRVALKLLPHQFASDADRVRRFEQEARAVSALNHPNILTLFDLGRAGDQYFMATEFIAGRTLRAHLVEQSRLPPDEAVRIASQCAAALASAHAAGIVHRDIKPENVMLRDDGYVKVLDFGLARVIESSPANDETGTSVRPNLTSAGVVLGTTAYLSPEQARAQPVDARTDVFSLGIVLYEMLAGTRPFAGPTPSDTLAAILREDPAPLSRVAPGIPPEIERILTKALAKDREARYASVAELRQDLEAVARDLAFDAHPRARVPTQASAGRQARPRNRRAIAGVCLGAALLIAVATWQLYVNRPASPASASVAPAGLQRVKTLAVLPFTLLGYSAESEHLGLGMADALIVKLTNIRQLTVRPTSAVQKYQTGEHDVQTVGRALQVDAVLMGKVQRAGGRTRVTVQLVGTTGAGGGAAASSIWSDEFTTATDDPFEVQDQLAAQLVQKLALQLSGDEQSRLTARSTSNPKALQSYMQGRFFYNKRTVAGNNRALELFTEAVRLDPRYAQAYLGQVLAWDRLLEGGAANLDETLPKLHAALDQALTLDPAYGEAYGYRSLASRVYDWKFDEADRDSARSMELDPNNPVVLQWRGIHLLAFGRVEEALALHARSVDIDPVDLVVRSLLSRAFYLTKRYDESIRTSRAVLEFDANQSAPHQWIGLSQAALGRVDESIASLKQAVALSPGNDERQAALAYAYAVGGRAAEARELIAKLEAPRAGVGSAYHIATIHAGLGDREATLRWLDRAWQERNGFLANRVKLDPRLDLVRQEPRFQDLLRRMFLDGR